MPATAVGTIVASPRAMSQNERAHQIGPPRRRPRASQSSDEPSRATGRSLSMACTGWPKSRNPRLIASAPAQEDDQEQDERDDRDQAVAEHQGHGQRPTPEMERE